MNEPMQAPEMTVGEIILKLTVENGKLKHENQILRMQIQLLTGEAPAATLHVNGPLPIDL